MVVTGESRKNEYILSNDLGSFYDGIEFEDNKLVAVGQSPLIRLFVNIFILAMLAASVFFHGSQVAMGSIFGKVFCISTFGESHGSAIWVIIDGCPAGVHIDQEFIQGELARRKPGQSRITTQRQEEDQVEILSGIFEGRSTGTPIAMIIRNQDQKSKDYSHIADKFRPSHAGLYL